MKKTKNAMPTVAPTPVSAQVLDTTSPQQPILEPQVQEKLRDIMSRFRGVVLAKKMWDRLTDEECRTLGGSFEAAFQLHGGNLGMWMKLHPAWQPRAIVRLAHFLSMLEEMEYRCLDRELSKVDPSLSPTMQKAAAERGLDRDLNDEIDLARSTRQLVLVQGVGNYRVYWKHQPVKERWGRNPRIWELLWQLAENAEKGRPVGWDELTGSSAAAIKDRRSRLKDLLPADLNVLIRSGEDKGTYRLQLPPDQIKLVEVPSGDWLNDDEPIGDSDS